MNIQAKDLRKHNYLEYFINEDGVEWTATKINVEDILDCDEDNTGFNLRHRAITLTPEILIKAGFVLETLTNRTYYLKNNKSDFSILFTQDKIGILFFKAINCKVYIYHLHQLQNLYWCLTQNELTIEL